MGTDTEQGITADGMNTVTGIGGGTMTVRGMMGEAAEG
jgi:hypothetical protein